MYECSKTLGEHLGFGEMHPVYPCGLIGCECNSTIGIPRVWWDASCVLLCPHWVLMQPNHRNSLGLVRCILLIIVVLLCMDAAIPLELPGFGEVHPVHSCVLIGCECNQNIGIPWVLWAASCLLLCPHWVWMQQSHMNSWGFGEMHPASYCGLTVYGSSQTIGIPRVGRDVSCLLLCPHRVWMQLNHRNP